MFKMAKLVVDSRGYRNTLDSKNYTWLVGDKFLTIIKNNGKERLYIPLEAINYLWEVEDQGGEGTAKGK
jgi:hypothetical protein